VYNEEDNLETLLNRLLPIQLDKEIVVVDDCSSDKTPEILQRFADRGIKMIRHENNQGKGAGIRTGLQYATGEYVIIQDADNELDPNDILRLFELVTSGKAQVVYGARNLGTQSLGNRLGNQMLTLATNLLFGIRITDMETCYKLVPTAAMRQFNLQSNSFDIEPEITAKIARAGYRIVELPIAYTPRTLHKKMRPLREGLRAIRVLIKYRFGN